MEVDQIIKLMEAVSKHDISEVSMEENGFVLTIKKENEVVKKAAVSQTASVGNPVIDIPQINSISGNAIKSPLVGTFYAASAPGAEPFIKVGDAVKKGQVLGIVEAMKLMNEIESEYDGIVKSILVEDGNLVEYGQEMFIIA